jgi:hypothetical protein
MGFYPTCPKPLSPTARTSVGGRWDRNPVGRNREAGGATVFRSRSATLAAFYRKGGVAGSKGGAQFFRHPQAGQDARPTKVSSGTSGSARLPEGCPTWMRGFVGDHECINQRAFLPFPTPPFAQLGAAVAGADGIAVNSFNSAAPVTMLPEIAGRRFLNSTRHALSRKTEDCAHDHYHRAGHHPNPARGRPDGVREAAFRRIDELQRRSATRSFGRRPDGKIVEVER